MSLDKHSHPQSAPKKNERQKTLSKSRAKLAALKNQNSPDYYLDKATKKIDLKKVKEHLDVMQPGFLLKLAAMAPKEDLVRKVLFQGDMFKPANNAQEKYIGLADVYRYRPEVRWMMVNGQPCVRKGFSGSFYYVETDDKGKPKKPVKKRGYAAILDGTSAKPMKKMGNEDLKKLYAKYEVKDKKVIARIQTVAKNKLSLMYKIDSKEASKLILEAARNEGVNPEMILKALLDRKYPKGFLKIHGYEPFNVMVRWVARLTAINEEKFKAQATDNPRKGHSYTKDFLTFNSTGKFPKSVKLKTGHKKLWRRPISGRVLNLRNSVLLENLTAEQIARIRAKEKHLPPEKLRQIKKRLFELERKHLAKGGTPGFVGRRKDLSSEYYRLLSQLKTPPTETLERSETFKRRLDYIRRACKIYKLPKRFVPIMLSVMRYESNYGQVMINKSNAVSSASGVGQFLWSTWKKFLSSVQNSDKKSYFVKARKRGHLPTRADDFFMIHAMAWHLRRSVDYMVRAGMSEQEALNLPAKWYYIHYHDGDRGALALRRYLKTRDPRHLKYNFQTNWNGRYDPVGRTNWIMNYSGQVQRLANGRWAKYAV